MLLVASGAGAERFFTSEAGGHRWQRVSPTEKRNRVHTSTVTVAVLKSNTAKKHYVDPKDIEVGTYKASGKGGQHRNKRETAIRLVHKPTGIIVTCSNERSQQQNLKQATEVLYARLATIDQTAAAKSKNKTRKTQIGAGMRGDKIRTYRVRDDIVIDHRSHRKTNLSKLQRGDWSGLK